MHCENCGLAVETEVVRRADPAEYVIELGEGPAVGHGWFHVEDVECKTAGDREHGPRDVGEVFPMDGSEDIAAAHEYRVELRVDICANCAVPIAARTYTVIE